MGLVRFSIFYTAPNPIYTETHNNKGFVFTLGFYKYFMVTVTVCNTIVPHFGNNIVLYREWYYTYSCSMYIVKCVALRLYNK